MQTLSMLMQVLSRRTFKSLTHHPETDGSMAVPTTPEAATRSSRGSTYGSQSRMNASNMQAVKIIDKPSRKIKEIRVFFDDGTYESFVPSSK